MPDPLLTKLATCAHLKTLSDIKNEIPEWQWADEYGEEVLTLLAPIDVAWHEENKQMKAENKAKRARVSAENKAKRYEIQLAQLRQATAKRRAEAAAAASFHRGILQPVAPQYFHPAAPLPTQSQSLPTHYGHQAVPLPMPVPVLHTLSLHFHVLFIILPLQYRLCMDCTKHISNFLCLACTIRFLHLIRCL
jgi:hypothetical protein